VVPCVLEAPGGVWWRIRGVYGESFIHNRQDSTGNPRTLTRRCVVDHNMKKWKEAIKQRKREEKAEALRRKTNLDALKNAIRARYERSQDEEEK